MTIIRINIWYSMSAYVISWDTPIHWTPAIYTFLFFFIFFDRPTLFYGSMDMGNIKKNTTTLMATCIDCAIRWNLTNTQPVLPLE